jgi:hypothetical protein
MKYKIEIELNIQKSWASIEDFELEIQKFNEANKDEIEVKIKSIEEIEEE